MDHRGTADYETRGVATVGFDYMLCSTGIKGGNISGTGRKDGRHDTGNFRKGLDLEFLQ